MVKNHIFISENIIKLESESLSPWEQIQIIKTTKNKVESYKIVQMRLNNIISKNKGFEKIVNMFKKIKRKTIIYFYL